MRHQYVFKVVCSICLATAAGFAGDVSTFELQNAQQASSLAHVAFEHARDTGDFWYDSSCAFCRFHGAFVS